MLKLLVYNFGNISRNLKKLTHNSYSHCFRAGRCFIKHTEYYTVPQQNFKINVICNLLIFISSVCTSNLKKTAWDIRSACFIYCVGSMKWRWKNLWFCILPKLLMYWHIGSVCYPFCQMCRTFCAPCNVGVQMLFIQDLKSFDKKHVLHLVLKFKKKTITRGRCESYFSIFHM